MISDDHRIYTPCKSLLSQQSTTATAFTYVILGKMQCIGFSPIAIVSVCVCVVCVRACVCACVCMCVVDGSVENGKWLEINPPFFLHLVEH